MPIYEFVCTVCGERFEALRAMGDTGKGLACPRCGSTEPEKVFSSFASPAAAPRPGGGCGPSSGFG